MAVIISGGFLTIYSPDRSEIYGELTDGIWEDQNISGETSYVISGLAGDGTFDEILRLNAAGIDQVAFDFDSGEGLFQGIATLLRPQNDGRPGGAIIRIETDQVPTQTSRASLR